MDRMPCVLETYVVSNRTVWSLPWISRSLERNRTRSGRVRHSANACATVEERRFQRRV